VAHSSPQQVDEIIPDNQPLNLTVDVNNKVLSSIVQHYLKAIGAFVKHVEAKDTGLHSKKQVNVHEEEQIPDSSANISDISYQLI